MKERLTLLEKERLALLHQWSHAKGGEKAKILVKIMDIDEQLGLNRAPVTPAPKRRKAI